MSQFVHKFAELVKAYRKKHGLNQKDLATLAKLSISTIEKIESGRTKNITLDTFVRLTAVIGQHVPQSIDDQLDDRKLTLLTNIFFRLASCDEKLIELYDETFESYLSIVKKCHDSLSN